MYLFNGVLLLATLLAGGPWASAQPQAPTLQALTESLPPLNYEHEGKITGFASELLDLMAAEAGIRQATLAVKRHMLGNRSQRYPCFPFASHASIGNGCCPAWSQNQ